MSNVIFSKLTKQTSSSMEPFNWKGSYLLMLTLAMGSSPSANAGEAAAGDYDAALCSSFLDIIKNNYKV
jgi:hypothetical protein